MTDEEREDLNTFKHDLVKQARWWQWKAETLEKEKEQLKAENAALRKRLEKAVELKAKVGDTIYVPWIWDGTSGIAGIIVMEIQIVSDGVKYYVTSFTTDNLAFAAHYKFGKFQEDYFGKIVFTTREAAEARLAELKGGKG